MPDLYASFLAARTDGDLTIAAGQAGVAALDDFLATVPGQALTLSAAQLQLGADQVPGTLTVDGDLAQTWLLPGLDTQALAVQHATITYRQPSSGAAVTADLSLKAALTIGADTIGLTGTLRLQSELDLSWSAGAPGGTLSLGDALRLATDGRSSFAGPAGTGLFASMSLSSAAVSLSYSATGWTTMDFTLAADPGATWDVGPCALRQIGVTFTAVYNLAPEDFQISFGGKIFATFQLEQEFGVAIGLSPSDVWELDLTAERGLPALESVAALVGAGDEVRSGLASVGLGDITLTAVRIGVNRADNSLAFVAMQGSILVAGTPFDAYLELPDFAFGATLPDNATISLAALLGLVLGETGGLPDLVIRELDLAAVPRDGSYSVIIAVADNDIAVGGYGLAGATISLAKQGSEVAGAIGATISLAGATIFVEGAYSAGWSVSGQVDQLSLRALIAEVLPDIELPAELIGLNLAHVSATWNITTGSFTFTGEVDLGLVLGPRGLSGKLLFSVSSTVDPATAIRTTTGSLTGAVALGPMTFNLRYDLTPGRTVLTGTWDNVGQADIPTLARAFGLAVPPFDVQPTLTLTSVAFDVDWAATGEQAALLTVATTAGGAFFLVERPAPAQDWGFVFGLAVTAATRLSQLTALVGLDTSELDFIRIDSAYLLVSSAAFPALHVPGFAAFNGIAPSGAGVSAGVRLDLGATPARPDVAALRALLASRPPVLQADVALSRDPQRLAVTVKLDGSLEVRGAGRSSLTLSDVSLVLKPQPVALTVQGSMSIPVDNTTLTATGFLTAGDSGVTAAFNIAGTGGNSLPSPLGLKGVHLSNIGVEIEVAVEPPAVAAGLLGRFTIGPGLPPPAGPPVRSRALAAMPPPGEFALILGLEGDLPNPLLLSMYLPELSVDKAVQAFTDQPAQNLPQVLRDIAVRDLMLYWCDAPAGLQLPDGTWAKAGFGFNATLDIYGFRMHGVLKIDSSGITGDACLDPVHVQGVIDLTGTGAGTPATYAGQVRVVPGGPAIKVSTVASPYLELGWQVVLFGVAAQTVNAEVTNSGFTFSVNNAGPGYSSAVSATFRLPGHLELAFSVLLNLDLDLGVVNGVRLGQVHLANTAMAASLVASTSPSLMINVNGTFSFDGTSYTMPQLSVTVPFRGLSDIPHRIFDQLKNETETVFAEFRTSADAYLEAARKGIVRAGNELGTVLHGAFQQTEDQAAAAMKAAGYQINDIGVALQRGYGATAQQAAETLKQAGYAADQVADALKTAYGTAADQAALFLRQAGFTVNDIARVLEVTYGLAAGQIAQMLKLAGFSFDDIGFALHADFGLSPDQLAAVLRSIGEGIDQVGNFLKELFGLGPTDLGPLLRAIGYAADEVKQFFETLGQEFEEAVKHLDPTTW